MRPWETQQGLRPWETSDPVIYNRLISIFRDPSFLPAAAGFGVQDYQEAGNTHDASIFKSVALYTGVPCSIQEASQGRNTSTDLPGDAKSIVLWKIFIPLSALAKGSVNVEDFITDELGIRYHVIDPYWDGLGYRLFAQILET